MRYINIYHVDRAYGGPEEGGWWYDCGMPFASFPIVNADQETVFRTIAREVADAMNEGLNTDISSVISDGQFVISIEDHYATPWPEVKPHYE